MEALKKGLESVAGASLFKAVLRSEESLFNKIIKVFIRKREIHALYAM